MADKIVAEYIVKTDKAVAELNKIIGRLDKIEKEQKKTQDGFKEMSTGITSAMKKVGGAISAAFAVDRIIEFGKESIKLAAQAEGVERAFKRIGGANSANLLEGLRRATRGTVSDLQLMQKAVQASNFKIPLENLASLFKFAQARARETGESVEYLTNSIVLGIGRKSPLILDNLGISAVELRNRLKGVGVEASSVGDIAKIIGEIAEEELAKMGNQADTTADQIEQITAAFENMQVEAGKAINDVINGLVKMAEKQGLIESKTPFREQIRQTMEYARAVGDAADSIEDDRSRELRIMDDVNDKEAFIQNKKEERIELLKKLEKDLSQVTSTETRKAENLKLWFAEQALESAVGLDVFQRSAAKERIKEAREDIKENTIKEGVLRKQIEALKEILGLTIDDDGGGGGVESYTRSINQLNTELKDLKKRFNDAEIGGSEWNQLVIDISKKTSELEAATTKATAKLIMFQQAARGFDPFAADEFDDTSAEGIGLDLSSLDKENEAISEAIDDQVAIRKDGSERIQNIIDEQLRASLEANDKELESAEKLAEDKARIREQEFQEFQMYVQAVGALMSSITSLQSSLAEQELQSLQQQLEAGAISREEYEKRRKDILKQQAEDAKSAAIFEATINGALAVVNAFSEGGPVLAAIVAAAVAAEVAAIASRPVPQFAEGGFVNQHGEIIGRSHAQGGVLIEAEGNEFITKGKYAQQNADILRAINSGDWEKYKMENIIAPAINQVLEGGFQGLGASYTLNAGFNDKNLLRAIDRHRTSDKDGFVYLANELKKVMNPRKRGGFA
jgi:hypothetical protein